MGVVKSWLLSMNHTHPNTKHVFCSRSIPWSLICGFMLFGLGLISLLTGHLVSHVEWYSQRFVHRTFFSSSVCLLSLLCIASHNSLALTPLKKAYPHLWLCSIYLFLLIIISGDMSGVSVRASLRILNI